jgi:hypothetical protein
VKTLLILLAQYDGKAAIPVQQVCADYFAPLTVKKFLEMATTGDIDLPVVRMYGSQKAAKGIAVEDLAAFLDRRIASARRLKVAATN